MEHHQRMIQKVGLKPSTWILDNKCSNNLKISLSKQDIVWQLVPPHNHRANAAEREIQKFKHHFKVCLAMVDRYFPLREWDRLLVQTELTMNLLHSARVKPRLSAYAYLFGNFDYNKTLLFPPGTRVLAHTKVEKRAIWEEHGKSGWYIGPSMEHYCCVKVFFPKTRSERNIDTVIFFPAKLTFPDFKTNDFLKQANEDIITILTNSSLTTTLPL